MHAETFAEWRQALRTGQPTAAWEDMLRYSDKRWAGRWPRYYHAHGSQVVHTGLRCGFLSGRNARAQVTLLWWLSGQRPTLPLCRRCAR
jgi:formylglycine-generating enzyme required for sulfatase activity